MKSVSVERVLKELQDDTLFVGKLFSICAVASKIHFAISSTSTLSICICFYNIIRHSLTKSSSFCTPLLTLYLLMLVSLKLEFASRSY